MSSKPKSNGGTGPQTTSAQVEAGEVSVGNAGRTEEIRRRAYEIYLERGVLGRTQAGEADNR
jgi:hypothetical protein